MRVLLTNDDGMGASGLEALYERIAPFHEVTVVAPDRDRSGASQSVTVDRGLTARPVGLRRWSLDGTPADCVRMGLRSLCMGPMDFVVSGINHGANLGTDILLSGTVGAARQAALLGVPAIAVSCVHYSIPEDARFVAGFVAENLEAFAAILEIGQFININAPAIPGPLAIARPGNIRYAMEENCMDAGDGARYLLHSSRVIPAAEEDGEDWRQACRGAVVLSAFGLWGSDGALESRLGSLLPILSRRAGEFLPEIRPGASLEPGRPGIQKE